MSQGLLEHLQQSLSLYPANTRYWVAFSGGLDSTVLLHAMSALQQRSPCEWKLSAVHVHHGLNGDADEWAKFCQQQCQQLDILFEQLDVDATAATGVSPEDAARKVRYQAISKLIDANDVLITAHHQDDQAETLFLQLMRGCGVPGLAAMPVTGDFFNRHLLRPFLHVSRRQLQQFAEDNALDWVEDSSNRDQRFDRNFMRHQILPELSERWPAMTANLGRTAQHMAEAAELLDQLAQQDIRTLQNQKDGSLSISGVQALDQNRQRNLLRYWLRSCGLPVPSHRQLQHILTDVLESAVHSTPCVQWGGAEVRRYRDGLYAMPALSDCDGATLLDWDMQSTLKIPGSGSLQFHDTKGPGLSTSLRDNKLLQVRFRQGGEQIRPVQRGHQHELKKLFQEAGIPPWVRERTPILYLDEQIIAVAGLCICEPFQATKGHAAMSLDWQQQFYTI